MATVYVGIDPGAHGFFAIYDTSTKEYSFIEMPKIGKFIDILGVSNIVKLLKNHVAIVALEDVHSIFGVSAKSNWSFSAAAAIVETALVCHVIPYTKVQPKKWQKLMWEGIPVQKKLSSTGKTFVNDTKLMSKMAAKRLFPNIDLRRNERCKVEDDGKIDALLLVNYARRTF